jgi:hypothetical protein
MNAKKCDATDNCRSRESYFRSTRESQPNVQVVFVYMVAGLFFGTSQPSAAWERRMTVFRTLISTAWLRALMSFSQQCKKLNTSAGGDRKELSITLLAIAC